LVVAQEHVNDPPFPSLSSYDGIPPNKTYQAAALINAARNTGGSIGEVCYRCWNLRPVTILVNERPDGTHVSHGMLANLPAFYDDRTPLLSSSFDANTPPPLARFGMFASPVWCCC
jgi:hypothetical protein